MKSKSESKKEALEILEEANNLITEAKYLIEELIPKYDILTFKNDEIFETTVEMIKLLGTIKFKGGINRDLPIEAVYKILYRDYKNVCKENKQLKKDLVEFMQKNEFEKETATLQINLLHKEREIESLTKKVQSRDKEIERLEQKIAELKRKMKKDSSAEKSE